MCARPTRCADQEPKAAAVGPGAEPAVFSLGSRALSAARHGRSLTLATWSQKGESLFHVISTPFYLGK